MHVLYGVNTKEKLFGLEELTKLHESGLPVMVETTAVQPGRVPGGQVTSLLRPKLLADGNRDVCVCGPPAMVQTTQRRLKDLGFASRRIHFVSFSPPDSTLRH